MKKIALDEILGPERYERERETFRRHIIALKRHRRITVGDSISFVFENRATVLFQIQEMLRAERITDLDKVRFEVDVYNQLLPGESELSSTMFIEITEQARIRAELVRLIGIDRSVFLRIGEQWQIPALFEAGRSTEENLSAVQYVRFSLPPEARAAFCNGQPTEIRIDHPHYRATASLSSTVQEALAMDLTAGGE